MAKFVLVSTKQLLDLVKRFNRGALGRSSQDVAVSKVLKSLPEKLKASSESYRKVKGEPIPQGRSAVSRDFFDALKESVARKSGIERRTSSMREIDKGFYESRSRPGGSSKPADLGEKGARTNFRESDGLSLPSGSPRSFSKKKRRQIEEQELAEDRRVESDLAITEQTVNRRDMREAEKRGLLREAPRTSEPYVPRYRKRGK